MCPATLIVFPSSGKKKSIQSFTNTNGIGKLLLVFENLFAKTLFNFIMSISIQFHYVQFNFIMSIKFHYVDLCTGSLSDKKNSHLYFKSQGCGYLKLESSLNVA